MHPNHPKSLVAFLLGALLVAGCSRIPNEPHREPVATKPADLDNRIQPVDCGSEDYGKAVIEKHRRHDLVFFEFSERGNIFNRELMRQGLEHIRQYAETGVEVYVFVHGWKHNAADGDSNVKLFRESLDVVANSGLDLKRRQGRRIIGVYVGWRGLAWDAFGVKELNFWDRKAVAEEVGQGGVTELLVQLRNLVHGPAGSDDTADQRREDKSDNMYLIIGHSFGGAIVLSSLHDVLVERLVNARYPIDDNPDCHKAQAFADGVVLLNPAIEANQAVQLKELASGCNYPDEQLKLMHVISTEDDTATNDLFPVGQWIGVSLTWNQDRLFRYTRARTRVITLDEHDLDTTTVGNLGQYRTGPLKYTKNGEWQYKFCPKEKVVEDPDKWCSLEPKYWDNHIPRSRNDPLVFIHTGEAFMEEHNDVFNCNVQGYLASIVHQSLFKKNNASSVVPEACKDSSNSDGDGFDFGACFQFHREVFRSRRELGMTSDEELREYKGLLNPALIMSYFRRKGSGE